MEDFQDHLRIKISGKTHYAMISFLKKHGGDSHDLSDFIEDAINWRILDRELAYHRAQEEEEASLSARQKFMERQAG